MSNKEKKRRNSWKSLLMIPAVLAADVLIFTGCIAMDGKMAYAAARVSGNAVPALSTSMAVPVVIFSALATVAAIVITLVRLLRKSEALQVAEIKQTDQEQR